MEVADYYSAKLAEHGETPQGVDWNGAESQVLRFEQLTRIIDRFGGLFAQRLGMRLRCIVRLPGLALCGLYL